MNIKTKIQNIVTPGYRVVGREYVLWGYSVDTGQVDIVRTGSHTDLEVVDDVHVSVVRSKRTHTYSRSVTTTYDKKDGGQDNQAVTTIRVCAVPHTDTASRAQAHTTVRPAAASLPGLCSH